MTGPVNMNANHERLTQAAAAAPYDYKKAG